MIQKCVLVIALMLCSVYAQEEDSAAHPAPEPYSFAFEATNEDGSSTAREETGDAEGRITGWYIIKGLDGQDRRVDYVADENGFRAEVSTSELGTVSHETSDAIYRSSSPGVSELISKWEESNASGSGITGSTSSGTSTTINSGSARSQSTTTTTRTRISESSVKPASPVITASRTEVVRSEPLVTPEGYVLVPASAAKQVGLSGVESERFGITADRVSSILPGSIRSGSTTTTTTSRRIISSSASVQPTEENTNQNEPKPSGSTLIRRFARRSHRK